MARSKAKPTKPMAHQLRRAELEGQVRQELREMLAKEHPELSMVERERLLNEGVRQTMALHTAEKRGAKFVVLCECGCPDHGHLYNFGKCKTHDDCPEFRPGDVVEQS